MFPKLSDEFRKERLQIPNRKLKLIIDTDAKNEVDDQFAIAWALKSPDRFDVQAVYAEPFSHDCFQRIDAKGEVKEKANSLIGYAENPRDGMNQSYQEIVRIYDLLGMDSRGKVFHGADSYMDDAGGPVESDAVYDLIRRARETDEILYVAAIGVITNIASAILLAPDIIKKMVVVWLAGQPVEYHNGIEFNMMQDVKASQIIFDCGVPLIFIPCMGVASALTVSKEEICQRLAGKNPICDFLASMVLDGFGNMEAEISMVQMDRSGYLKGREDQPEEYFEQFISRHMSWSRIIWDIAAIAYLKNPNWLTSTLVSSPILHSDLSIEETINRHRIRIVNYCHRGFIVGDLFYCLTEEGFADGK